MRDQPDPTAVSRTPRHIGELVRRLRECAGLTRCELSAVVNVSAATLRNLEGGRPASLATWLALRGHPCMTTLLEQATLHGLSIESEALKSPLAITSY